MIVWKNIWQQYISVFQSTQILEIKCMECASCCFKYIEVSADFWIFECNGIAVTSLSPTFLQKPLPLFILLHITNTSSNFVRVATCICITQAGYSWGESSFIKAKTSCLFQWLPLLSEHQEPCIRSLLEIQENSFFNLAMVHGQIKVKSRKILWN